MRRPIIAGNWKMNKTPKEAQELVQGLKRQLQDVRDVDIAICPPFTSLTEVKEIIQETNMQLGAQDVFWKDKGAYTGEVSSPMLKAVGCQFVIIGHSERRTYFGESNESVNKKTKAALEHKLTPIVCVGERLEQREKGQTLEVIKDHVQNGLKDIAIEEVKQVVMAYEPVWAIGTGITATPDQAEEAHSFIRRLLAELYNEEIATVVRIQYGGSVKPENIRDLMSQPDIDGALVGGASLKVESFVQIVKGSK